MEYRIHITLRRKGKPVFASQEFKTEAFDSLSDLMATAAEFATQNVYDDEEGRDDYDEDEPDR